MQLGFKLHEDWVSSSFLMMKEREGRIRDSFVCSALLKEEILEKKRKEAELSRSVVEIKRIRRTSKSRRPLLAQSPSEQSHGKPKASKKCAPSHPGQFEGRTALVTQMSENQLVASISFVLESICSKNEGLVPQLNPRGDGKPPYRSEKYPDGSSSIFFSLHRPSIMLANYLLRFVRYMNVSRSVFIVGLVYLDRVKADDELLALTQLNAHRLITAALSTASKYLEDESHRNSCLSRIGGVPSKEEMNMLEIQFLRRLHWNCSVSEATYQLYEDNILRSSRGAVDQDAETTISIIDTD